MCKHRPLLFGHPIAYGHQVPLYWLENLKTFVTQSFYRLCSASGGGRRPFLKYELVAGARRG